MKLKSKQGLKGFTIIEVVLVLAIAGLIFLMVFIALPNMQRSQRDTQRRNDYAALSANITNYISNNNGQLPADGATLAANRYVNTTGKDPDGSNYTVKVINLTSGQTAETIAGGSVLAPLARRGAPKVFVYTHADCSGTATAGANAGTYIPKYNSAARAYAVYGQLETGTYCQAVGD